jgi:hypothetical protein
VRATRICAAILLVFALGVGVITTYRALRQDRTTITVLTNIPRLNGRLSLAHDSRDAFVDYVRNLVPADAPVRIIQAVRPPQVGVPPDQGPSGRCGNRVDTPPYWLLVYELLPRPSVCDGPKAWTIFFGVPVPSGPTVHRFTATLGVQAP